MTSICLVIPYFAKTKFFWEKKPSFPPYFSYFIKSFSGIKSDSIHLKLLTNIPFDSYKKYRGKNITVVPMSLKEVVKRISKTLDLRLNPWQFKPFKLCDFRPAFGLIFADLFEGYDFWGYCDADMVIGNLADFFTEENLTDYELVTASRGNPGYMTIYRNNEKMNNLFRKSPDHLQVFNSDKSCRFDEKGSGNIIALTQLVEKEKINRNNIEGIVHNDCGSLNKDREWKYIWQNGILTDSLTGQKIGSLHLVKSKRESDFIIEPIKDGDISIEISKNGMKSCLK